MLWAEALSRSASCGVPLALVLAFALPAHAADRAKPGLEACASASEAAQSLLDEHKLLSARERLLVCTQTTCPAAIKRDCDELLSKVDATMPSIVLSVRDSSGQDVVDAQVTIDGAPLPNALQGRALPIDPGSHTLHFERAGAAPQDLVVVAHEGERARDVIVHLTLRVSLTVPTSPASEAAPSSGAPWPAWVLGGVGVVGLGAFAVLAANGQSQYNQCTANGCSQSESASLERERVAGFASLGVGLAASAASVWFFVVRRNGATAARTLPVRVGIEGSSLRLSGSF